MAFEFWYLLKRRRWLIFSIVAMVMLVDSIYILQSPRIYSATSTLVITSTQQSRLSLVQGGGEEGAGNTDVASAVSLIRTNEVMRRAVSILTTDGYSISQSAILAAMTAGGIGNTSLINVTVEWPNPGIAQAIANAVAQAFVDQQQYQAAQVDNQTVTYLGQELQQASDKLAAVEQTLKDFQIRHGLGALTDFGQGSTGGSSAGSAAASGGTSVIGTLTAVRQTLQDTLRQQAVNDRLIADQKRQLAQLNARLLAQGSTSIAASSAIDDLQQQLLTKEAQLASSRASYTPEGIRKFAPDLSLDIRRLQEQLNAQIRSVVSGDTVDMAAQQKLTSDLVAAEMQEDGLRTQIASLRQQISALEAQAVKETGVASELSKIVRQRDVLQQVYQVLVERQEAVSVSLAAVQGNAEIASRASLPTKPIRPVPLRDSLLGLAFGLFAGCSLALLMQMDNTIRTMDEITQRLSVPPLAAIPSADTRPALVWQNHHSSATLIAESFRMLRSSINYLAIDEAIKSILITSAVPGEGKTSIAANLAVSMAMSGKRVIIVDADLRKPSVYRLVGGGRVHGLAEVLTEQCTIEQAVRPTDVVGLWTIPVEKPPPNPVELLSSHRMKTLLDYLHSAFDVVIVDSPPCLVVADAIVLASQVDAVIQVVAAGETTRKAAGRARDMLVTARGHVVGAILNRFDPSTDSSYYYYYHYYRSYKVDKLEAPDTESEGDVE